MQDQTSGGRSVSSFILKLIAIVSMLIDHTAHVFGSEIAAANPWLCFGMHAVGRLAFPLFAFGVAEGASKTSSGKKYLKRMLLFALISQIPFSLMCGLEDPAFRLVVFGRSVGVSTELSVMTTLFLGLALCLSWKEKRPLGMAAALAAAYAVDYTVGMDYGMLGVLFVFALYAVKENKLRTSAATVVFAAAIYFDTIVSAVKTPGRVNAAVLLVYVFMTALAALPMVLYNGKRGPKTGVRAYIVYPAHIAILMLLRYLVF
ncbi:MAG: hypothetical protein J5854_06975 [Clostridia bacterium]|nr:hypothetical protein [Clostridia bacterium]